jgi:tetratricopeptide (TPR) repeat protein
LNTVAAVTLELGLVDESIALSREKLDRMTKVLGATHHDTIEDRRHFASTLLRLGRTREGAQEIDTVIELVEASDPQNPRQLADALNYSVWYLHRGRDNRRALQQAERAVAVMTEADLNLHYVFHTLAEVELLTGDYAAAQKHCQQAADALAAQGTPGAALSIAVCLGDAELGQKEPETALALFKQASQLPNEGEEEDPLCRARVDFGLARALWESQGPSRSAANHARAAEKALIALQSNTAFGHLAKHRAAAVARWLRSHRAPAL